MAETVLSVGIDIGTSTTQLVFSSLASSARPPCGSTIEKSRLACAILKNAPPLAATSTVP